MAQLLFGMNVKELAKDIQPKSLRTMHIRHGTTEGRSCGECVHFYKRQYGKVYFKCELYSDSKCEASDWRKKWQACGKFVVKEPIQAVPSSATPNTSLDQPREGRDP